jgi:lipopolysaccharide-induced tumor necrosis factor-alpha factor
VPPPGAGQRGPVQGASPAYMTPAYTPQQSGQPYSGALSANAQIWTNSPQVAVCPQCRAQGVTNVKFSPGACTWLSCIGCVCVGCYLGCCLIPFCIDSLQDCNHHCSSCGVFLGRKTII